MRGNNNVDSNRFFTVKKRSTRHLNREVIFINVKWQKRNEKLSVLCIQTKIDFPSSHVESVKHSTAKLMQMTQNIRWMIANYPAKCTTKKNTRLYEINNNNRIVEWSEKKERENHHVSFSSEEPDSPKKKQHTARLTSFFCSSSIQHVLGNETTKKIIVYDSLGARVQHVLLASLQPAHNVK